MIAPWIELNILVLMGVNHLHKQNPVSFKKITKQLVHILFKVRIPKQVNFSPKSKLPFQSRCSKAATLILTSLGVVPCGRFIFVSPLITLITCVFQWQWSLQRYGWQVLQGLHHGQMLMELGGNRVKSVLRKNCQKLGNCVFHTAKPPCITFRGRTLNENTNVAHRICNRIVTRN